MNSPSFATIWTAIIEDAYGEREEIRFGGGEDTESYTALVAAQTIVRMGWWDEGTKVVLVREEEMRNLKLWGSLLT